MNSIIKRSVLILSTRHIAYVFMAALLLTSVFTTFNAFAAPGDITYKPALGKLGEETPFKVFNQLETTAVNGEGRLFALEEGNRIVRFDADGNNPIYTADATKQDTPFNTATNGTPAIASLVVGENNTLYGFGRWGVVIFDQNGFYQQYQEYPDLDDGSQRGYPEGAYYNSTTNELIAIHYVSTTSRVIEVLNAAGEVTRSEVFNNSNPEYNPSLLFPVTGNRFSVVDKNGISVYDQTTLDEAYRVDVTSSGTKVVDTFTQASTGTIAYTYEESDGENEVAIYTNDGVYTSTSQIAPGAAPAFSFRTTYDAAGSRYEFIDNSDPNTGYDNPVGIKKYTTQNVLVYEINQIPRKGILGRPGAMTIDRNNNTYVYDGSWYRVTKFSPEGVPLLTFGQNASGQPDDNSGGVYSLVADASNNIYLFDAGVGALIKYSDTGVYLGTYDITALTAPHGVTFAAVNMAIDGSGDMYFYSGEGIVVLNSSVEYQRYMPYDTTGEGALVSPTAFTVDRFGNSYISDAGDNSIKKYSKTGEYLLRFGQEGDEAGNLRLPYGIATDLPGNVYVSDVLNNRIQKFSNQGEFLLQFGSADPEDPFYLGQGLDIAINRDYDVFVADGVTNEVKPFEIEKNDSSIISADGRRVIDNIAIEKKPTFAGATEPYASVTVTVHSDPVSCTATADAEGNWSCTLPTELPAGQHTLLANVALANNSTLELGPYPVHVVGAIGTPGTTLGEGLIAPNTGLLRQPIGLLLLSILGVVSVFSAVFVVRLVRKHIDR